MRACIGVLLVAMSIPFILLLLISLSGIAALVALEQRVEMR